MARKRKTPTLYESRVKDLRGLTSRRFTRSPSAADKRHARELHAAVFGRHKKVTFAERRYDPDLERIRVITTKSEIYEPGIMSWAARDPAKRKELYRVMRLKNKKRRKSLQRSMAQDKIHPMFDATVFRKQTVDGQTLEPKLLRLRGFDVVIYGFTVRTVIAAPDDFVPSEDLDESEGGGWELLEEEAGEFAADISEQLKQRGYRVGEPTFQIMCGPHAYRAGTGRLDELRDQHVSMMRRYNTRDNAADRYDTWFSGIMISVPFGYFKEDVQQGRHQDDQLKQRQMKDRRRRSAARAKRERSRKHLLDRSNKHLL